MKNQLKRFLVVFMVVALWTEAKCMDDSIRLIESEADGKFLLNTPGSEEWRDNNSNYAPSSVRRAADELWESGKG